MNKVTSKDVISWLIALPIGLVINAILFPNSSLIEGIIPFVGIVGVWYISKLIKRGKK